VRFSTTASLDWARQTGGTDSEDAPVIAHPAGLRGFDLRCSVTDVFHALKTGRSGPEDACIPSGKLSKGCRPNAECRTGP
jgi:hypothetical protein